MANYNEAITYLALNNIETGPAAEVVMALWGKTPENLINDLTRARRSLHRTGLLKAPVQVVQAPVAPEPEVTPAPEAEALVEALVEAPVEVPTEAQVETVAEAIEPEPKAQTGRKGRKNQEASAEAA